MSRPFNNTKPFISVIIPTYNREKALHDVVELLCRQEYPRFEIVVVSQGNRLATGFNDTRVRVIHLKQPNLPEARNAGVTAAQGEVILFLDDDIVPSAGLLQHHADALKRGADAVVGRIIDERNTGRRDSLVVFNPDTGEYITDFARTVPEESISMAGGNTSLWREVFDSIAFDPFFFANAHWEEVDVAFRLRAMGKGIFFEPAAAITHLLITEGGCRSGSVLYEHFAHFSNTVLFFLKHGNLASLKVFTKKQLYHLEYLSRTGRKRRSLTLVIAGLSGMLFGAILYSVETLFLRKRLSLARFAQDPGKVLP